MSEVVVERIDEGPLGFVVFEKYEYCVTTKSPQGSSARWNGYTGVAQLLQNSESRHVLYFIGDRESDCGGRSWSVRVVAEFE